MSIHRDNFEQATGRTTFARATRAYDPKFERAIVTAVSEAIAQVSLVTDANAMVLRTGEIIAALTTMLASTIALSPAATRSPTQLRKFLEENAKRLQRKTMQAVADPDTKRFRESWFNGNDVAGRA